MQEENAELATVPGNGQRFSRVSSLDSNGGADGIRTHDLLDAIEARSQLRHGPTGVNYLHHFTSGDSRRPSPVTKHSEWAHFLVIISENLKEILRPKRACEESTRGGEKEKRCARG